MHFLRHALPRPAGRPDVTGGGGARVIVIGVGTEFRRDDGAGPAVIDRLRGTVPAGVELLCSDGEPTRLMEAWMHAGAAVVVDAVGGGDAAPGTLHRVVVLEPAAAENGPAMPGQPVAGHTVSTVAPASSHGLGLSEAIELSRVLSRLPALLILHAVQGEVFGYGQGFSPAVAAAIDDLTARVRADVLSVSAS
jgi:hydrogenase maturation protease